MKIWIDLRLTSNDSLYTNFIRILTENLIKTDKDNSYIIYSNHNIDIDLQINCELKIVNEKPWSFSEHISLNSSFKNERFSLMIFFNHEIPIFYKENFIIFVPSLKELFFNTKWFFEKWKYNLLMNISLKNCKKVICLDNSTSQELNEKLNIKEELIETITPFFLTNSDTKKESPKLNVDIKSKYNLKFEYLIYDGWNQPNSNLSKLFKAIIALKNKKIDINLLMLSDETISDIDLRQEIIDYNIQDRVFFIWNVKSSEEKSYYTQSLWIVFPSIYESFPFRLSKALNYNVPIIASKIPSIENTIWDSIILFNDPISATNLIETLEKHLTNKVPKVNYKDLLNNFPLKNTTKILKEIIYKNIYDN